MSDYSSPLEGDRLDVEVVVAGGGPAGLATAIRLKQMAPDINVVVLEKGARVGAHILSGAVIDPIGLDTLLPDWRKDPELPIVDLRAFRGRLQAGMVGLAVPDRTE